MKAADWPQRHKVRVLHGHTGWGDGSPCAKWDGQIGLFLNAYGHKPKQVYRAADGSHRGGGCRWIPIGCNTPGCEFRAIVRVDWLERMIAEAVAP